MPAQSQQQQKLFGLALSVKRGEISRSEASKEVLNIVDDMTEKEIEDFAGTSHKNLPKKVENLVRELVRKSIKENLLNEDYGDQYTAMASSSSIKLLMKIPGVKRNNITTKVLYNQGKYPKKEHFAYLKGFHKQQSASPQKEAHSYISKMPKIEGVYYFVSL